MTRPQARELRRSLPKDARARWSARIAGHILAWPLLADVETVMAYASTGSEAETGLLLESLLAKEKRLLLPRCLENGIMVASEVRRLADLRPGRYGIAEPQAHAPVIDKMDIDLVLAPGLLFDRQGRRMGQGGGYYDRFLAGYRGYVCGIAFEAQVVRALPAMPHDMPMDALATERGIYTLRDAREDRI